MLEFMMTFNSANLTSVLLISLLALSACNMPLSNTTKATAVLSAGSEVPPTASTGAGEADIKVDVKADKLSWTITYSGLSGAVISAHFHGPAEVGANAGVAIPITGDLLSPIKGEATITAAQKAELLADKWYVNLHTAVNPEGEIRGQVLVNR